jgi:hypothetical protein
VLPATVAFDFAVEYELTGVYESGFTVSVMSLTTVKEVWVVEVEVPVPVMPAAWEFAAGVGVGEGMRPLEMASETGQTVVYNSIVSVVTEPSLAGQLVTVFAQLVMVYTVVVEIVRVVFDSPDTPLVAVGVGDEDSVSVTGQTVV